MPTNSEKKMTSSGVTLRYKVFYTEKSVKIARESCMLCLIFPENFAGKWGLSRNYK